jgi:hypothetical protein
LINPSLTLFASFKAFTPFTSHLSPFHFLLVFFLSLPPFLLNRHRPMTDIVDLELTLHAHAPASAAGTAVGAVALNAGMSSVRATRLQALIEQIVLEIRARECVNGAEDILLQVMHGDGRIRVRFQDHHLPAAHSDTHRSEARHMVALGFADRLQMKSGGIEGNFSICDIKINPQESDVMGDEQILPESVSAVSHAEAQALQIRPMQASDAQHLAKCVYRCYGYSYPNPMMYESRHIQRALKSGMMHSVVAVTPKGEVVGHCALTFDSHDDLVPEAGKMIVDPRYRGHHLSDLLAKERKAVAERLGLVGFWSECVTNHPFSQREIIATGGAETGLLIGAVPAGITMQGLVNAPGTRLSLLPFFVPLKKERHRLIHLPARHLKSAQEMAQSLGLAREINTDLSAQQTPKSSALAPNPLSNAALRNSASAKDKTQMSVAFSSQAEYGHIHITHIGDDLLAKITHELDLLQQFHLAVVHCDLPLDQPRVITAIEELESLKFFWGAWLPEFNEHGDVLRLQRINRPVDTLAIVCARPEGEAVRDHVITEWARVREINP